MSLNVLILYSIIFKYLKLRLFSKKLFAFFIIWAFPVRSPLPSHMANPRTRPRQCLPFTRFTLVHGRVGLFVFPLSLHPSALPHPPPARQAPHHLACVCRPSHTPPAYGKHPTHNVSAQCLPPPHAPSKGFGTSLRLATPIPNAATHHLA